MPRAAGLPLVTLFDITDRVNEALPPPFQDMIERFVILGLTSRTAPGAIVHRGALQGLDDSTGNSVDSIDLGFGTLNLPLLTDGLPFQLTMERAAIAANLEPGSERWQLDLILDDLSLTLPVLEGATFVKETGTFPRHLLRTRPAVPVTITGGATLRFEKPGAGQPVQVRLIDRPDPFDPRSLSGGVARANFTPPHFFLGSSEFGMTVTSLMFDFSDQFSPPLVLERGQSAAWMGLVVAEATIYAPPNALGKGGFSGGVRNLLLGSPLGIQGEVELQWGRSPLNAATVLFRQDGAASDAPIGAVADPASTSRIVQITASQDQTVGMAAALNASSPPEGGAVTDWSAEWRWPDGAISRGDSARGTVRHGQTLRVTPIEEVGTLDPVEHPEISFRFVASGEAPFVDVTIAAGTHQNVVQIEGPGAEIAALTLTARSSAPGTSRFVWSIAATNSEHEGATFQPPLAGLAGTYPVKLREIPQAGEDRVAHVMVRVFDGLPMMIGTQGGVFLAADPATILTPHSVIETFDLSEFHASGATRAMSDQAVLDPAATARVAVPSDGLAHVLFRLGGAAPEYDHDRHVQILMVYDKGEIVGWGPLRPARAGGGAGEANVHRDLLDWAANYPGARFLIVGRCDDIGSDSYNVTLAQTRFEKAQGLMTRAASGHAAAAIASSRIISWGEQAGRPASLALTPDETATYGLTNTEDDPLRLITVDPAYDQPSAWPEGRDTAHAAETTRTLYRRVDIYAIGGTPAEAARTAERRSAVAADTRRSMIPAAGREVAPAETSSPKGDYRVKLVFGWDKPHASWRDLAPNLAEFEYAWTPAETPLPNLGGQPVDVSQEVLTVYGKYIHDDLTGFTRAMLGIKSDGDPRGLFWNDTPALVAAAGFGPMLLSGVDFGTDTVGSAARVAALAGVMAASNLRLGNGDPLIAPGSEFAVISIEAEAETRAISDIEAAYKIRLTTDYTVKMHLDGGFLGFRTHPDNPVKIRYQDVGVEFDSAGSDFWEQIGFAYKTDSMLIEDPGRWIIDGELGDLLRIVEVALGTGSFWIEARLAIALDIGVVEISEAVIRLTFDGGAPDFSLRGLVARVNVPGAVEGEGRLRLDPDGTVKAGLDVSVIPLQMKASAGFAMKQVAGADPFTFVNLYLKVVFPVGIPLGTTGAAIHGFVGQTVINGTRDVAGSSDVVTRELAWWGKPPEDKYRALKDQHAIGLGVVIGTLPDASFSFSVMGMLVVAFPDPEVILGVEVQILQIPVRTPSEDGGSGSASITGLVVIDDEAVTVAVAATYEIPKLIKLRVPFGAYFPYSGVGTYVRIGSDGQGGRGGEPVTITILPGSLDLQAWAYLMIEADGLPSLGGRPEFSFDGFSIGFGAGMGIEWKAGPIKLSASAYILVGLGTDPLFVKGGLFVSGELDLVVISISARGSIILTYKDEAIFLDGEFCGEVDMWFFSIKGCVKFKIGTERAQDVVQPPAPVASVSLIDRASRVMGEAAPLGTPLRGDPIFRMAQVNGETVNTGVAPKDNHTVWADTAPVLNFRHYAEDAVPTGQFSLAGQPSGDPWFGSNRLKYGYKLRDVRLTRVAGAQPVTGTSGPLKAVWITSPVRQPDNSGTSGTLSSGAEVQSLKLLDWDPFTWAVPMDSGGAGNPGDPATTVGQICDPLPQPARACVYGADAVATGPHAVRLRQITPAPGPYPSRFYLSGEPKVVVGGDTLSGLPLMAYVAAAGLTSYPGAVTALPRTLTVSGRSLTTGYRLPAVLMPAGDRRALPWHGRLDQPVRRARLTLLACDGRPSGEGGGDGKTCLDFRTLQLGEHTTLVTDFFALASANRDVAIIVSDRIAALPAGGGRPGSDGVPDITILNQGAMMKLRKPCTTIEIEFYRPNRGQTVFEVTDVNGASHKVVADGPPSNVIGVTLHADAGIASIAILPETKMIQIYRLCCVSETASEGKCEDFTNLPFDFNGRTRIDYKGFVFESLNPGRTLGVNDQVDETVSPPRPGNDGTGEVRFPDDGVRITLPRPCRDLSLHVMLFGKRAEAKGLNAAGEGVANGTTGDEQRVPQIIRLRADTPMTQIMVAGGGSESVIYRICCHDRDADDDGARCFDFTEARLPGPVTGFRHEGITFQDLRNEKALEPRDEVSVTAPAGPGQDGRIELGFGGHGFGMVLDQPAARVTLRVFVQGNDPVVAEATDGAGRRVARAATPARKPGMHVIDLAASDMRGMTVMGGDGKAVIYEVCLTPDTTQRGTDEAIGGGASLRASTSGGLPVVTTTLGSRVFVWPPRIVEQGIEAGGRRCALVEYDQPVELRDTSGFVITAPAGRDVTILALCGVDARADDNRAQDQEARDDLVSVITDASDAGATGLRDILLEPGQRYRIEVFWSWRSWESASDGQDSPSNATAGPWQDVALPQTFEFLVASEDLASGLTGDGLNEYKFDPADIARYLTLVDPADGRSFVFTDDPLWAHFSTRHLESLLAQYGRKIDFDVHRTDPPPQVSDAARAAVKAPLDGIYTWLTAPQTLEPVAIRRLNAALLEAPCLPDDPAFGGASLSGRFELEPNAMYDFNLIAPRLNGSDPRIVSATRFVTSRYANPEALMQALGFSPSGISPFTPEDLLMTTAQSLPMAGSSPVVSDMAMGAALAAIGAETLPLPGEDARSTLIWRPGAGGVWTVAGLLLDAPEPMRRETAVDRGTRAEITTRCAPLDCSLGGTAMRAAVATLNWTRVLFVAPAPITPPPDQPLVLQFTTSEGPLLGRRRISLKPGLIEAEGF